MLKVKKFEARTLLWWAKQRDKIDFNPPYQRKGRVWLPYARAFLIDSIINGFDIPKVYLADFTYTNTSLNTGNKPYAVIDGKQRLEAIFDFLDDKYPLNSDFIFRDNPEIKLAGLFYSQIQMNHELISSDIIDQFNLDVVSVISDDQDNIRELFIRLNQGAALKGAEVRNAMSGVLPEYVRSICNTSLIERSNFNKNRGQDKNAAAKTLLIAANQRFVSTKKRDIDEFFLRWSDADSTPYDENFNEIIEIFDRAGPFFRNPNIALKSEALIPLYYMFFKDYSVNSRTVSFLENFGSLRNQFRLKKIDDPLIFQFNAFIRNSNDASGMHGAYEILRNMYLAQ